MWTVQVLLYVQLYQTRAPDCGSDLHSYCILAIRALHSTNVRDELYFNYGSSYDFNSKAHLKVHHGLWVLRTGSI